MTHPYALIQTMLFPPPHTSPSARISCGLICWSMVTVTCSLRNRGTQSPRPTWCSHAPRSSSPQAFSETVPWSVRRRQPPSSPSHSKALCAGAGAAGRAGPRALSSWFSSLPVAASKILVSPLIFLTMRVFRWGRATFIPWPPSTRFANLPMPPKIAARSFASWVPAIRKKGEKMKKGEKEKEKRKGWNKRIWAFGGEVHHTYIA